MAGKPGRSGGARSTTRRGNGQVSGGVGAGGPATGKPAQEFQPGNPGGPGAIPTFKSLERAERVEALQELRWQLAHQADTDAVRLSAINAAENREIGPVQPAKGDDDAGVKIVVIGGLPDA